MRYVFVNGIKQILIVTILFALASTGFAATKELRLNSAQDKRVARPVGKIPLSQLPPHLVTVKANGDDRLGGRRIKVNISSRRGFTKTKIARLNKTGDAVVTFNLGPLVSVHENYHITITQSPSVPSECVFKGNLVFEGTKPKSRNISIRNRNTTVSFTIDYAILWNVSKWAW